MYITKTNSRTKTRRSYAPTINKRLVALRSSKSRKLLGKCNNYNAFLLKEPLKISVDGTCYTYDAPQSQMFLLNNLRANKYIKMVSKIITPIQSHSNCWFNTMFVALFISDKGRKFFHFFRQLMIEGKRVDGSPIPSHIWHAFALLNFAIEACLTGDSYAYKLNTNKIIHDLYVAIQGRQEEQMGYEVGYVVDIDYASNPINYYKGIMSYLNSNELEMVSVVARNTDWFQNVSNAVLLPGRHIPHIIVLEIYDVSEDDAGASGVINNKQKEFSVGQYKYSLDSCIVRDTEQEHFSATLTCNGKEMAYDGASFHRLLAMKWSQNLNSTKKWKFKGSEHGPRDPLYWSFMHGYQMLLYYRVE